MAFPLSTYLQGNVSQYYLEGNGCHYVAHKHNYVFIKVLDKNRSLYVLFRIWFTGTL